MVFLGFGGVTILNLIIHSSSILAPTCVHFRAIWGIPGRLGGLLDALGRLLRRLGGVLGASGGVLERLRQ